jgi:hypothetical protein
MRFMPNKRVEWRHSGKRLILPVAIMPRYDADNCFETFRTYGLLDTGATGTGLRPDAAEYLSLPSQGRRRIETANGILWASEYVIRVGLFSGDLGLDGAGGTDRLPLHSGRPFYRVRTSCRFHLSRAYWDGRHFTMRPPCPAGWHRAD